MGFGAGELRSGLARGTGWTIDRNWAGQAGISGFEGQRIAAGAHLSKLWRESGAARGSASSAMVWLGAAVALARTLV